MVLHNDKWHKKNTRKALGKQGIVPKKKADTKDHEDAGVEGIESEGSEEANDFDDSSAVERLEFADSDDEEAVIAAIQRASNEGVENGCEPRQLTIAEVAHIRYVIDEKRRQKEDEERAEIREIMKDAKPMFTDDDKRKNEAIYKMTDEDVKQVEQLKINNDDAKIARNIRQKFGKTNGKSHYAAKDELDIDNFLAEIDDLDSSATATATKGKKIGKKESSAFIDSLLG